MIFRDLTADEISCRVGQAKQNGCILLLYIDARCAQAILDETVGAMNWQRLHTRDNANCIVSIWDDGKKQWVPKEDTGTTSNAEKEKGIASDSFKRACVNWGIGRELLSAPVIWIPANECKHLSKRQSGGWVCSDSFCIQKIVIENKKIKALAIKNQTTGKTVFVWQDEEFKKKNGGKKNGA